MTQQHGDAAVERHRTAIGRSALSKPVRLAEVAGLLPSGATVLDYGCGRGGDVRRLVAQGFDAVGWDPVHRADGLRRASNVVNLGFVLNVIEAPEERVHTLMAAWELALDALVVAVIVNPSSRMRAVPFGDGVLTSRGTFQKYFHQKELEDFLREHLPVEPIALGHGIFVAVRDAAQRAALQAMRVRRRAPAITHVTAQELFASNREALEPLMGFFQTRGRLPSRRETAPFEAAVSAFGSWGRATSVVGRLLTDQDRNRATTAARDDLALFLALAQFGGRPRFSDLPEELQEDVRAFFGSYGKATQQADELLFSLRQPSALRSAVREATFGKLLPGTLYVHMDGMDHLPLVLRLYEGCARRYVGSFDDANLVKMQLGRPVISYLTYPDFTTDPHPALATSMQVDMRNFQIRTTDYSERANPPVLHRKELFLPQDHEQRAEFATLTKEEEAAGLLIEPNRIGTRDGWKERLRTKGYALEGHALVPGPT